MSNCSQNWDFHHARLYSSSGCTCGKKLLALHITKGEENRVWENFLLFCLNEGTTSARFWNSSNFFLLFSFGIRDMVCNPSTCTLLLYFNSMLNGRITWLNSEMHTVFISESPLHFLLLLNGFPVSFSPSLSRIRLLIIAARIHRPKSQHSSASLSATVLSARPPSSRDIWLVSSRRSTSVSTCANLLMTSHPTHLFFVRIFVANRFYFTSLLTYSRPF